MNRTQLSAFSAVAEMSSFTKGAAKLMVSQPAVSLQVAELEAAMGVKLFERLPRGVRLTAAGELLQTYARRIDGLEHEAIAAIAELRGLVRGRLIIGASLTIGSYLLPAMLGRFRLAHPGIELDLQIANTQQIDQMVRDSRVDLAFTEGLAADDLSSQVIHQDQLLAIAPPGHPLTKQKTVSAAMFGREPVILREAGSGTREVIEDAFARRRIKLTPLMSLGSTEAIKRAVQAGIGLSIVSELALDAELAAKTLAVIPLSDLPIRRPLRLLRPPAKIDSPAAAAFVKLLRDRKKA